MTLTLRGMFPAFPTPLTETGDVDDGALERIVDHQIRRGAAGLVPLGGTGEAVSLTMAQRRRVLDVTVSSTARRVPVVAGVLDPGLGGAIDSIEAYETLGADALMVIAPYYARPDQEGARRYFRALAARTRLPLVLYDNPYRTSLVLTPDTILSMVEEGLFVGMKASNTDLFHFDQVAQRVGPNFGLLSGQDTLFVEQAMLGARGGVLTSACLIPDVWNRIQTLVEEGRIGEAVALQRRLQPLFSLLFDREFPSGVKRAYEALGLTAGSVLAPATDLPAETREVLAGLLRDLAADGMSADMPSANVTPPAAA